jgi:hypothetical protein
MNHDVPSVEDHNHVLPKRLAQRGLLVPKPSWVLDPSENWKPSISKLSVIHSNMGLKKVIGTI